MNYLNFGHFCYILFAPAGYYSILMVGLVYFLIDRQLEIENGISLGFPLSLDNLVGYFIFRAGYIFLFQK